MKRNIVQGLGAFTPSVWAETRSLVDSRERKVYQKTQNRTPPPFYAKLTSATKVAGRARWKYEWEQVVRKADTSAFGDEMFNILVDGRSSDSVPNAPKKYAVNLLEVANTEDLAYGISVTTDGVVISSVPTYSFRRIPQNTIVEMRLTRDRGGDLSPTFSATNPIDGDCPEP